MSSEFVEAVGGEFVESSEFVEVDEFVETTDEFTEVAEAQHPAREDRALAASRRWNLLRHETVMMTVLAQDPTVVDRRGPVLAPIPVPAQRLQRGPRGYRFHVVDVTVGAMTASPPVLLHDGDSWWYRDRWQAELLTDAAAVVDDRDFHAQNVFAVASHTLALFEKHLGRPIPWYSKNPQLYLLPHARVEANAFYSREHNAVLFGWLPAIGQKPVLYTALSYDVIAHEVSHAVLDGLRPRYTEPALPDQLAFHEALADLVAMFSVFDIKGVAEALLEPDASGRIAFPADRRARQILDPDARAAARLAGRIKHLKGLPLVRLAEQVGGRRAAPKAGEAPPAGRYPALRRAVDLPASDSWKQDPQFAEPHRLAEVLVAAFMQTFVAIWAGRLEELSSVEGLSASRVAEEGTKSAQHLLGMLLRALDYLPPVDLEFADVLDSVLTADRRLAPDDEHHYRDALLSTFEQFGITPPRHHIVDEDGLAAPRSESSQADASPPTKPTLAAYPADPDGDPTLRLRYEHLNVVALRSSPEEVYQFIWNNAATLGIDVRLTTRVERVLNSTRVGPDGLVVQEILADYLQSLRTTAGHLPPGIEKPAGMADDAVVEMWGGGVLVFDQFGRFRLHQRQPILDIDRQSRRLRHLSDHDIRGVDGSFGASDSMGEKRRFSLLHQGSSETGL